MDKDMMGSLINAINLLATEEIKIMEVCGTHTQMISKLGLRSLLAPKLKLLSGPGCPVCVSDERYIDRVIEMVKKYEVTIATFGDMLRVEGVEGSLLEEKAKGRDVRIIYSPLDLIKIAEENPDKNIVFLAVGFETTAPIIALTIKTAATKRIDNLFFLTNIKLMPPILHYLLKQNSHISGLICPGHVATIEGADYFRFIGDYSVPAAVCGFEAIDILIGIYYLVKQIRQNNKAAFMNLYRRCVRAQGNPIAKQLIEDVFEISSGVWRGIGTVENSALDFNEKYAHFDALQAFAIEDRATKRRTCCKC